MPKQELGFSKIINLDYDAALSKVTEELKKEGFGILTEIDVKETLKKKLGIEFKKYKILGACNPEFAHQALSVENEVGLFMPCNVIVYENEQGQTVVNILNPKVAMSPIQNDELASIADAAALRLKKVFTSL
jgi:uncharacterized protein (DUF302 family)